ncbi:HU family DNA-binding protein [Acidithiobacillus thiooxidans]|nr:HU family DNA-binding protein [Acidithiobacillus thiooxidans]
MHLYCAGYGNRAMGQEIEVPAKKSIKFKAGKEFAGKVNH